MIKNTSCIVIRSELNSWIDLCIIPEEYVNFEEVEAIAIKAFDEWFEIDPDCTITEYIYYELKDQGLDCEVYVNVIHDEEEE